MECKIISESTTLHYGLQKSFTSISSDQIRWTFDILPAEIILEPNTDYG